jgi:hypothetical protein
VSLPLPPLTMSLSSPPLRVPLPSPALKIAMVVILSKVWPHETRPADWLRETGPSGAGGTNDDAALHKHFSYR